MIQTGDRVRQSRKASGGEEGGEKEGPVEGEGIQVAIWGGVEGERGTASVHSGQREQQQAIDYWGTTGVLINMEVGGEKEKKLENLIFNFYFLFYRCQESSYSLCGLQSEQPTSFSGPQVLQYW